MYALVWPRAQVQGFSARGRGSSTGLSRALHTSQGVTLPPGLVGLMVPRSAMAVDGAALGLGKDEARADKGGGYKGAGAGRGGKNKGGDNKGGRGQYQNQWNDNGYTNWY